MARQPLPEVLHSLPIIKLGLFPQSIRRNGAKIAVSRGHALLRKGIMNLNRISKQLLWTRSSIGFSEGVHIMRTNLTALLAGAAMIGGAGMDGGRMP
jgi:hypothetical protein